MGSDMANETGLIKGNAFSLILNCGSDEEIKTIFEKLSEGGTVKNNIETTFWGALFGDFTDKFENNWILNFNRNSN